MQMKLYEDLVVETVRVLFCFCFEQKLFRIFQLLSFTRNFDSKHFENISNRTLRFRCYKAAEETTEDYRFQ